MQPTAAFPSIPETEVQRLYERDREARLDFVNWYLHGVRV
jgi:hypothetical protein